MCLNNITKVYAEPDMSVRKAYKIMQTNNETPFQWQPLTPGVWESARSMPIRVEGRDFPLGQEREFYTSGFHVFPTRAAARKAFSLLCTRRHRVIRKVEVKGVTYEGTDGTGLKFTEHKIPNLVAQWIRLVPGKV